MPACGRTGPAPGAVTRRGPAWKIDTLAAQAKLWRPAQLAEAAVLLADADADAKGGLGDTGTLDPEQKLYAVERLLLQLGRQPAVVS